MYFATQFQSMAVRFLDRFVRGEKNGFEHDTPRPTIWMETSEEAGNVLERRVSPKPRWLVERGHIGSRALDVKTFHLDAGPVLSDKPGSGAAAGFSRSAAPRVGKEVVRPYRSRWSALHF